MTFTIDAAPLARARTKRPTAAPPRSATRTASERTAAVGARPAHRSAATKGGSYWLLLVIVVTFCLLGVVMVLSASSIVSLSSYGSPWHFFIRQWIWLMLGVGAFVFAVRVDHQKWRRLARPLMYVTIALLFAVLVPGIGVSAGGASRWIGTSSIQIQPSELAKIALIFFVADVLDRRAGKHTWLYRIGPVLAAIGALVLLVMLQPDMGTSMVLVLVAGAMLWTAGLPGKTMAVLAGGSLVIGYGFARASTYRWQRMMSFIDPFKTAQSSGYQSVQGLLAMGHGGVLGDGIGSSLASYGYLPNAQTDFIFAVIGEETGLAGGFFVCALFAGLALIGVRVACRAPSRYSALLATGITAWVVGQAIINIGAVVGLLPVTGVPLPFVSFGGSALVIALFGVGVLANIAKQS